MKKYILFFVLIMMMGACAQKKSSSPITEKIQYDVQLRSNNPDADWWVNNMEGSKREKFVENLLAQAFDGEIEVYDFFTNNKLSQENLNFIKGRIDTILMQSPEPPYNDTTLIIEQKLEYRDISRVRFMEEWVFDGDDIRSMEKNIIAIAPLLENYDETGNFRGYQPLFWIYTEK